MQTKNEKFVLSLVKSYFVWYNVCILKRGNIMKVTKKLFALSLGAVFAISALAACGPGEAEGSEAAVHTIVYDNLGAGYVDEASTSLELSDITIVQAYNASGSRVSDASTIATYEDGVVRGVSQGTIVYRDSNDNLGRIEVVPAYITDPGEDFRYTGSPNDFAEYNENDPNTVLGHTHDPSLIETTDSSGRAVYYIFSSGWSDQSTYYNLDGEAVRTYGNAIHVSYDGMKTWSFLGRTFDYATRDQDFINTRSGAWLYREGVDSTTTGTPTTLGTDAAYSEASASWWAPDIVAKPDGSGYWLYTCVVDGAGDSSGMRVDNTDSDDGRNPLVYARACILLYESDSLLPGSFTPVLDESGDPVVLMQSSILRGETVRDVNGIDPQIIYDTEGNMYMAYGSFGSGNYMIELDPETGLRKDGMGWQSHTDIRNWIENDIQDLYNAVDGTEGAHEEDGKSIGWTHSYYGTNLSKANMEAPVLARHDNVTIMDENENILEEGKTYYYTMHSYDGLADNYQMWGGRSESVWGVYKSTTGGIVYNVGAGNGANEGNKYMGAFTWHNKSESSTEYDFILPGHNDLFTNSAGTSVTAYILRQGGQTGVFLTQIHQYYLNSYGEIVINPNRYAGESDRPVSAEELFAYTDGGKFKMVVSINQRDTDSGFNAVNTSRDVTLEQSADDPNSGAIYDGATTASTQIGTWKMYGNGYIKFTFTETLKGTGGRDSGETVYYGVVRNAWLADQNRSGFTITCLGQTEGNVRSMSMFMNNYSTITGDGLVG